MSTETKRLADATIHITMPSNEARDTHLTWCGEQIPGIGLDDVARDAIAGGKLAICRACRDNAVAYIEAGPLDE